MDKDIVRYSINTFFKGAGIDKTFNGPVNEKVAEVFGKMLTESTRCSSSLSWVPRPTGGKATISWVARNFSRSIRERMRDSQYLTCAKTVIYKMMTELEMAARGL